MAGGAIADGRTRSDQRGATDSGYFVCERESHGSRTGSHGGSRPTSLVRLEKLCGRRRLHFRRLPLIRHRVSYGFSTLRDALLEPYTLLLLVLVWRAFLAVAA